MATNIPSNSSNLEGDDSHIFRRTPAKSTPKTPPEEPTELLEFEGLPLLDDDEDALGGSGTEPRSGDSPSMIVRRGYREGSSVDVGGGGGGSNAPGESGSSIFAHADAEAGTPGSGWFDSTPPAARSIPADQSHSPSEADLDKTHLVKDLFAGLDHDSTAVPIAGWQEQQATNSITESEVIRAFDNLSSRDVTKRLAHPDDAADFNATQLSGSHIFPNSSDSRHPADERGGAGDVADEDPSGVDLLNADWNSERFTGPRSSIFGAASNQEASQVELDAAPHAESDDATEIMIFSAPEDGSSIFKKTPTALSFHEHDDGVDLAAPSPAGGGQGSGHVDWSSRPLSGGMEPSPTIPFDEDADVDPFADEPTMPAPKRGLIGTSGAGVVVAPAKSRVPDEDEDPIEATKPRREPARVKPPKTPSRVGGGGLLGWVGGGLLGLLFGAGAFAGLYFGGVLPSAESTKPSAPLVQNTGPLAELAALTAKQDEMKLELATATQAATKAEAEMAKLDKELASAKAAVIFADKRANTEKLTAASQLKTTQADLVKANADFVKVKADAQKAATELSAAVVSAEKVKLELDEAKGIAARAERKIVGERDAAKKALDDATKLNANLGAMVVESQKKQMASEVGVGSIIKELKANKLLDEKVDTAGALAQLPDVLKKLTSLATSQDAKKAAEALAASKKELDTALAALKAADSAKARAVDDAATAKREADAKVAATIKKAEADLLAAKKETEAAKLETETKVATAVADAKQRLADAEMAALKLAQQRQEESKLLQAEFTRQLSEVRQGGTVQITPAEVLTEDRAARDYNSGVSAYQFRNYTGALAALESAVKLNPADARYWYYLGLTQWELGKHDEARAAFKKGYDLESRNKPNAALVGEALERIQGTARRELNRYQNR